MSTNGHPGAQTIHTINGELPLDLGRYELAQAATLSSRLEAFGNRRHSDYPAVSRGPISPPPLRRDSFASVDRIERFATLNSGGASVPSLLNGAHGNPPPAAALDTGVNMPRQTTPSPPSPPLSHPGPDAATNGTTPKAQTDSIVQWTLPQIITQLNTYRQDIKEGHVQLTKYILESTKATERRVRHGADLFASLKAPLGTEKNATTMRIKSKVHTFRVSSWYLLDMLLTYAF